MTTMADVAKALREVIVMNERVTNLAGAVQKLAAESTETRERLVRVETVIELSMGASRRPSGRALPSPD